MYANKTIRKRTFAILISILLCLVSFNVAAEHNSGELGHNPDRGYNRANCEQMESKTSGKAGEWLGHVVGCLVVSEDSHGNPAYVIIMEYEVRELKKKDGDELRKLVKEYENKGTEM